jgi:hypothetical protein
MPVVQQDTMQTALSVYVFRSALKGSGFLVKIVCRLAHLAITAILIRPAQIIRDASFPPTAQMGISLTMFQLSVFPNARAVSEIPLLAPASPAAPSMEQMSIILTPSPDCAP